MMADSSEMMDGPDHALDAIADTIMNEIGSIIEERERRWVLAQEASKSSERRAP